MPCSSGWHCKRDQIVSKYACECFLSVVRKGLDPRAMAQKVLAQGKSDKHLRFLLFLGLTLGDMPFGDDLSSTCK